MSDEHEFGPWIKHRGGGCPVRRGQIVHAIYDAQGFDLRHIAALEGADVIAIGKDWVIKAVGCVDPDQWDRWIAYYRVRKPRGLTILENIAQGVDTPEQEDA